MMDLPMPLKQCHRLDVRLDLDETGAPVVAAPGLSWELAAGEPNLVRGTVQIWRAQLDQAGRFRDQLSSVLSNEEYARAGRCQLEKERWRLIARRGLPSTVSFGAPFLK